MSTRSIVDATARLSKLRAMSLREIGQRVRYRAVIRLERHQHRRGVLDGPGVLRGSLVPALQGAGWNRRLIASRRSSPPPFLAGVRDRDTMRRLFQTRYQRELEATLKHAALTRGHRFEFFGREFQYGSDIDWQADPVTGSQWPVRFHADVLVDDGDVGCGDVKHVWELSRQQYLIDLGKAWFLTASDADLQAIRDLVRSWMSGNPYATGVNWSCALEPAFRVLSWLWAYHLTVDGLDDEFHVEWLHGFYNHGRFLARHLEHYSSPYNHLIGEATALYALGLCFPEFRESGAWRKRGRSVLEGRLREQFYPDGGSVEQSTFYHHATVGFYLLSALLGRASGEELSPEVWRAIERGLDFSMALVQPDGRTPEIGGADDGKPIRMEHLSFWDFRPYQSVGAVLFGRADFKAVAGRFCEDALWLLGPAGLETFEALPGIPPSKTTTVLEASGYSISRSDWSDRADYVCFDVGEQAAGMRPDGVPNSMHGHADCLSVIACLGGRRVLVDSGLYAYNCGGPWETHFRETAAHNTARVDGRDQARHLGKMAWSHSYRATVHGWMADGGQSWTIGSHDGYARGPEGVTHRRVVWLRPGGYLLIYDEFAGQGQHALEVNFQFAPGELQAADGDRAVFDDIAEIVWAGNGTWAAEARCGGPEPEDGWICSSLGVRQAAPRLTLRCRSVMPRTVLVTVLASRLHRAPRVSVVYDRSGARTALTVAGASHTDWIAASGVTHSSAIDMDASLAVCRVGPAGELERVRAGGTYLRVDAAALAQLGPAAAAVAER